MTPTPEQSLRDVVDFVYDRVAGGQLAPERVTRA